MADYDEDLIGQAKVQALGDIVRYKETTNQQVLKFYEFIHPIRANTEKKVLGRLYMVEVTWGENSLFVH